MLNLVVASGRVKSPALRFDSQARPEFRFTLEHVEETADGRRFTLYLPCCASGSAATKLAEELDEGLHIALTSAKLCYRRRQTQLGEHSRLEIVVWSVEVLAGAPQDERTDDGEGDSTSVGAIVEPEPTSAAPATKARRPRVPRMAQQPWQPEHAN